LVVLAVLHDAFLAGNSNFYVYLINLCLHGSTASSWHLHKAFVILKLPDPRRIQ